MSEFKGKYEIYRKDNKNYTLIIESHLTEIGKVKFVLLKRDDSNKRIDMADFYLDYQRFVAGLQMIRDKYKSGQQFNPGLEFMSEKDNNVKKLSINLRTLQGNSAFALGFMIQNIPPLKDGYTGKLMFQTVVPIDIYEFINITQLINDWQLSNVNKIISGNFFVGYEKT